MSARVSVICLGNEILLGHTVNTDLALLAEALHEGGYTLAREVCIPDEPAAIRAALREELQAADVVFTVGGLGPTQDDLTRSAIADELGMELVLDENVLQSIRAYLRHRQINLPEEAMYNQARVLRGAGILPNTNGTAPGMWCETGDKTVIMLPGPPRELGPMVNNEVVPRLLKQVAPMLRTRTVQTCGVPESRVAQTVDDLLADMSGVQIAYCARPYMVDVRLTTDPAQASMLEEAEQRVREELGNTVLPYGCMGIGDALGRLLRERNCKVAVAESCTGGLLGGELTAVSGASDYFEGGVIAYSNQLKMQMLNVSEPKIRDHGAVSEPVVYEMVRGVTLQFDTSAGIAVTGIAGPGGGTEDKPVGLVFVGTYGPDGVRTRRYWFPGDRRAVRQRTVTTALNQLRLQLLGESNC